MKKKLLKIFLINAFFIVAAIPTLFSFQKSNKVSTKETPTNNPVKESTLNVGDVSAQAHETIMPEPTPGVSVVIEEPNINDLIQEEEEGFYFDDEESDPVREVSFFEKEVEPYKTDKSFSDISSKTEVNRFSIRGLLDKVPQGHQLRIKNLRIKTFYSDDIVLVSNYSINSEDLVVDDERIALSEGADILISYYVIDLH